MTEADILVVEDEALVAMDIESVLQELGYRVIGTAGSGEQAMQMAERQRPDLVLMDIKLRGSMDGIETAARLREHARIPVVYLTAYADDELLYRARVTEPFGYILKPFQPRELYSNIEMALYKHGIECKLEESRDQLQRSFEGTVEAIARLVELRDPFIEQHQQRVAALSMALGKEIGLSEDAVNGLRVAAMMHDIGLVKLPFEVISKPGELNAAERALYEAHPRIGYDVVKDIPFPWPVADVILQHHENLDGSGFPAGLQGEGILLQARIINVANLVEHRLADRWGQTPDTLDAVLTDLNRDKGTKFDAQVVGSCERLFREQGFQFPRVGAQGWEFGQRSTEA